MNFSSMLNLRSFQILVLFRVKPSFYKCNVDCWGFCRYLYVCAATACTGIGAFLYAIISTYCTFIITLRLRQLEFKKLKFQSSEKES